MLTILEIGVLRSSCRYSPCNNCINMTQSGSNGIPEVQQLDSNSRPQDRDALLMSVRVYQSQPDDTAVYWIRHTPTESQHNQSQLYVSLQDTTFYDQSPFQIIVVNFLVLTFDKAGLDLYLRSYGLISFFRYLTIPYICCLVSRAGKTLWMSAFQASRRLLNISGSTVQREPSLISRIRVGDQFDYLMREAVRSLDNKHLEQEICFRYWNVLSLTCQLFSG